MLTPISFLSNDTLLGRGFPFPTVGKKIGSPARTPQGDTYTKVFFADKRVQAALAGFGEQPFGTSGFGGYNYTLNVMQYPDDTPIISRGVNATGFFVVVTLTPEETNSLDVGLWYIVLTADSVDIVEQQTSRLQVTKKWG